MGRGVGSRGTQLTSDDKIPEITQKEFSCLFSVKPRVLAMASKVLCDLALPSPFSECTSSNLSLAPCPLAHLPISGLFLEQTRHTSPGPLHCLFPLRNAQCPHFNLVDSLTFLNCLLKSYVPKEPHLTTYLKWQLPPCLLQGQSCPHLF